MTRKHSVIVKRNVASTAQAAAGESGCASVCDGGEGGERAAHLSMCRTFLPSTESRPDRTHSVKPVPRMI